jgi:hypothetical protein
VIREEQDSLALVRELAQEVRAGHRDGDDGVALEKHDHKTRVELRAMTVKTIKKVKDNKAVNKRQ